MRRTTIKDVAALAGVSPATVSRTLDDRPEISAETKERVRAACAQLGYVPNAAAINEAVEIAKNYEPAEVVSFINGILGSFVRAEFADSAPKPEKKEEEAAGPEEPEE